MDDDTDFALKFVTPSGLSNLDDARLSRVEAAVPLYLRGTRMFSGSPQTAPSAASVLSSGKISAATGIANTGNAFPFVVQGRFIFGYDGANLNIYFDGSNGSAPFVVRRADGQNLTVPPGTLTLAGLSPGTRYGFAPFIATNQPGGVSFVAGDSGTPRYAFSPSVAANVMAQATRTQRLSSNESLTRGLIYFTTPAAGTSALGPGTDATGNNPYTGQ